ncbi:MAG: magnesium transporter [Candidatus Pacearchaeota archaeon]
MAKLKLTHSQYSQHSQLEKHLLKKIPVVNKNTTVKEVISKIEKKKYDSIDYIYVVENKNLIGVIDTEDLFKQPKNKPVGSFMRNVFFAKPDFELERIAHLALIHNLKQVPIIREVGKEKRLIGAISIREILSVINKSLKRDILHFAGIHKAHLEFENSMEVPYNKAIEHRLSWLVVGFVGALLIALFVSFFESALAGYFIIASFIPVITYISDALGTQFQTLLVRDFAILGKNLNLAKYFFKQMVIGLAIALIFGILTFGFIIAIWHKLKVAFIISFAIFAALIITGFFSLLITALIKRFNFDPALGSGPIATIISDIVSVVIYFIIVTIWL